LYTDTDSFLILIETQDVYKDMKNNMDRPLRHERLPEGASTPLEHKQKGLGQNERRMCRNPHRRVCWSEYSILKADEKNIKKAKSVKKSVVKKQITHEQYKETLFGAKQQWHGMNILRSEGHEI